MKPIITVYSGGSPDKTKKLDGFITAAFWIGVDHAEHDLESVKVRFPSESYDVDVTTLTEFTTLLVQRQINFSVEFFTEPTPIRQNPTASEVDVTAETVTAGGVEEGDLDFEEELTKIKADYQKGLVTKKQYEAKRGVLLKRWKEKVEGRMGH